MSEEIESTESEKLSPEAINRLWQHGMQKDQIFNTRLQFFLALETMLIGIVALLISNYIAKGNPPPNQVLILRFILFLGLTLTLIWSYVQAREKYVYDSLRARLRKYLPEYAETIKERQKRRWLFSNLFLLTYLIPALFILIWVALQFLI